MSRKREAAPPALILFNDVEEIDNIPKIIVIDSSKYLVGRSFEANLMLLQKCISRKHCTFNYDKDTNQWSVTSHVQTKKAVSVEGNDLNADDAVVLKCGDKINITPYFVYEFKCAPDNQQKCCSDFKKAKLSNSGEESQDVCKPQVEKQSEENDTAGYDEPTVVFDEPELSNTLPISQLPDSSNSDEFYNSVTPSCSKVDFKSMPSLDIDSLPQSSSNLDLNLSFSVDDLENEVRNYVNRNQYNYVGKEASVFQKFKDELDHRLEYIRKLAEFNISCDLYFSKLSDVDIVNSSVNELSSFFHEDYSKLYYRHDRMLSKESDEHLNRIILNMDAILMEKTQRATSFMNKFLKPAFNKELPDSSETSITVLADDVLDFDGQNTYPG